MAHQQQGKLAHSALGEVPVMIPDNRPTILLLTTTVDCRNPPSDHQAINLVYLLVLDLASSPSQAARASVGT